jgi:SAM-dependent methyltransferase
MIKNRDELGHLLNSMDLKGLGAEIGVAYGLNTKNILDHWRGSGMFLIDPYDRESCGEYIDHSSQIDFDKCLLYCRNLLNSHIFRTIHLRTTSDEAYTILKSFQLDFVYIDGNHHNPQVTRDIENYWNVVKPGGILCGHDYYDLDSPGYKCDVKSSVDAFLNKIQYKHFFVTESCSSWYILK